MQRYNDSEIKRAVQDGRMDPVHLPKRRKTGDANPQEVCESATASGASSTLAGRSTHSTATVLSSNPLQTDTSAAGASNPPQGSNALLSAVQQRARDFRFRVHDKRTDLSDSRPAPPALAGAVPVAAGGIAPRVFEGATAPNPVHWHVTGPVCRLMARARSKSTSRHTNLSIVQPSCLTTGFPRRKSHT